MILATDEGSIIEMCWHSNHSNIYHTNDQCRHLQRITDAGNLVVIHDADVPDNMEPHEFLEEILEMARCQECERLGGLQ